MPLPTQPTPPVATGRARPPESSRHFGPIETPVEANQSAKAPKKGRLGTALTIFIAAAILLLGIKVIVRSNTHHPVAAPVAGVAASPLATDSAPSHAPSPSIPALVAGPNDPSGVPMPRGDIAGWHQTFFDDFTGSKVNKKWVVFDGQPLHDPVGRFTPSHISVNDGMATIGAWRSSPGSSIIASGGMSNVASFTQTYGKYDVRFRMDKGWGIAYAILLWPSNNNSTPEIDFAEDNGTGRSMTSASLHALGGELTHKETHGNYTQWHTAELIWTPDKLTYSIDGVVWATMTGSGVPHTPMSLSLQTESHPCGMTWEVCANKTTPAKVNLQIDWVAAYAATKK